MRRNRTAIVLAAISTLIGAVVLIVGPLSSPSQSKTSSPPAGLFAGPPPEGVDPRFWRPATRPDWVPTRPPLERRFIEPTNVIVTGNCYAPGTNGYEPDCRNPGYYQAQYGGAHWGDEPYYNTGVRFVWLMDSLWDTRTREHLNVWINERNASYTEPYGIYVVLYQAEELGQPRGQCSLNGSVPQWIDVCPTQNGVSLAGLAYAGEHLIYGTARISTTNLYAGTDVYKRNSIYHELGHTVGFTHDTDCASAMTYCYTAFDRYLGYASSQVSVVNLVYKNHTN